FRKNILHDDTDDCTGKPEECRVHNIHAGGCRSYGKVRDAADGEDIGAGSVQDESDCCYKKRENDNFYQILPLVDVDVNDYTNRCNQTSDDQPHDCPIKETHDVQEDTQAIVSCIIIQYRKKTDGKSYDNKHDGGRVRNKGKFTTGHRRPECIKNSVDNFIQAKTLVEQVHPYHPDHDNGCSSRVPEDKSACVQQHGKAKGDKNHSRNFGIVK